VRSGIARARGQYEAAERLREGFEDAILGAPNVGKSSLFNALSGRDAAITAARPGTTRDVLELRYDLAGIPVVFLDTAGLRETVDEIEAIGIDRAMGRAEAAAMRLFLRCADGPPAAAEERLWRAGDLRVWTKADLSAGPGDIVISALRGDGLADLLDRLRQALASRVAEGGLVGHMRQRRALEVAAEDLARAENAVKSGEAETFAEDIRSAFRSLERLIGRVGAEDLLDAVFAKFCLGK
jgi:tRNA modification GTPase